MHYYANYAFFKNVLILNIFGFSPEKNIFWIFSKSQVMVAWWLVDELTTEKFCSWNEGMMNVDERYG